MLQPRANVLGAVLADGWYSGYIWAGRNNYGQEPRLLVQLQIEYADGTKQTVGTDGTWKWSYGPLLEGDIQQGETYDARLEMPGWDAASFDESKWKAPDAVIAASGLPLKIEATPNVAVRRQQELRPIKITEPRERNPHFQPGPEHRGMGEIEGERSRRDQGDDAQSRECSIPTARYIPIICARPAPWTPMS